MKEWVTPYLVEILTEVIDTAIELTCADFGNIQLFGAKGKLKTVAQRHFPDRGVKCCDRLAEDQDTCSSVFIHTESSIADIELDPIFVGTPLLEILRRAGIRTVQSRACKWVGIFSAYFSCTCSVPLIAPNPFKIHP